MLNLNLKNLLLKSGKTQKELAEFIGVKQNTVSDWINKGTSPKVEQIYRIVDFFAISFDYLFTNTEPCDNTNYCIKKEEEEKNNISLQLSFDERGIIDSYRELSEEGKYLLNTSVKHIWAEHHIPVKKEKPYLELSKDKFIG